MFCLIQNDPQIFQGLFTVQRGSTVQPWPNLSNVIVSNKIQCCLSSGILLQFVWIMCIKVIDFLCILRQERANVRVFMQGLKWTVSAFTDVCQSYARTMFRHDIARACFKGDSVLLTLNENVSLREIFLNPLVLSSGRNYLVLPLLALSLKKKKSLLIIKPSPRRKRHRSYTSSWKIVL